jgi:hypothetical protein
MDAVAQMGCFATPLYRAALQGRLGKDPSGEKFAALAARLPAKDQTRLWDRVEKLEAEHNRAGRSA